MVGCPHQLYGHESEQVLGTGNGQGSLACCRPFEAKGQFFRCHHDIPGVICLHGINQSAIETHFVVPRFKILSDRKAAAI